MHLPLAIENNLCTMVTLVRMKRRKKTTRMTTNFMLMRNPRIYHQVLPLIHTFCFFNLTEFSSAGNDKQPLSPISSVVGGSGSNQEEKDVLEDHEPAAAAADTQGENWISFWWMDDLMKNWKEKKRKEERMLRRWCSTAIIALCMCNVRTYV